MDLQQVQISYRARSRLSGYIHKDVFQWKYGRPYAKTSLSIDKFKRPYAKTSFMITIILTSVSLNVLFLKRPYA